MSAGADWKVQAEYPGLWSRLYASFLDTAVFLWPISLVVEWMLNGVLGENRFAERQEFVQQNLYNMDSLEAFGRAFWASGISTSMAIEALFACVFVIVPVVFCWAKYSVTPGKFLARMRIVDAETGGKISTRQSIIRYAGYFVSSFAFFLGFIWIAFDKRHQGWHDKMAGTVVVYTASLPKQQEGEHV